MSDTGMDIEKVLARIKKDISNVVEHLALSNKQQADRIEELTEENRLIIDSFDKVFKSNVELLNPWIPVSERLPEDTMNCLVCCEDDIIQSNTWTAWQKVWLDDENKVTHWMPLPEPPKESSKDE